MAEVAIDIRRLGKRYGELDAVHDLTLAVDKGEIFGLIGPDGSGKTTLFQILAGVMNATSGEALVFGKSSREARMKTGYLTQGFTLYPDLTVMENIRYVGNLRLLAGRETTARGRRYLELFGMDRFANRLAGQLSGGMQKKLALACALVPQPQVLLLDEPTTGVDPVSRREFSHGGSYVSESDYFQDDWRSAYWGEHYARLRAIKRKYDPANLFAVHHGVRG